MDILLGEDGDAVFVNGQTKVTTSKAESVQQRLLITLKTFLGEWFLDTSIGVPYFEQVFGKMSSKSGVDLIFQQKIQDDPGVAEILEFYSEANSATRTYTVSFKVLTNQGVTTDLIQLSFGG